MERFWPRSLNVVNIPKSNQSPDRRVGDVKTFPLNDISGGYLYINSEWVPLPLHWYRLIECRVHSSRTSISRDVFYWNGTRWATEELCNMQSELKMALCLPGNTMSYQLPTFVPHFSHHKIHFSSISLSIYTLITLRSDW